MGTGGDSLPELFGLGTGVKIMRTLGPMARKSECRPSKLTPEGPTDFEATAILCWNLLIGFYIIVTIIVYYYCETALHHMELK